MRSVFSKTILAAAQADPKVLLLTGDHGYALFDEFRKAAPEQFINAGIAEQNMVGVAAGLAKAGFKPIVYGLSAFVPIRVLEQIKMDVCYENLPVVFIGDGAGLVYSSLGSSHQSTEDIAVLRPIPNISILSPCDVYEMQYAMDEALRFKSPFYLRMGKSDIGDVHKSPVSVPVGDLVPVRTGQHNDILFLATGSMVKTAIKLAETVNAAVWSVPGIKPVNHTQLNEIALHTKTVVTLEEHSIFGGLGSLVAETLGETGKTRVIRMGVQDRFSQKCGSYDYLLKEHGIDVAGLIPQLTSVLASD
ncbi:MAG TPA: transketolase C-terminal domain-containing protein [Cellvibrio sp.]|nr:transketolase C-terminal domain-containing protein [Cellvibrio sp.]